MNNDDTLRRQSDDQRLSRIEHILDGNGGPGVAHRMRNLERILLGDGASMTGLVERQTRVERLLFENPLTGEKGLVYDVKTLTQAVRSFQTTLRTLNWILGLVGIGGAITFLRSVTGAG